MPEFVSWLFVNPVRWLVPADLLACVVGIPLMLWRERRRALKAAELIVDAHADQVAHLYVEPMSSVSAD